MIVVQTFNRAGWPPNSTIELENGAAAALLTAVRDYEAEKHISLHGDYLAAPVGGDRTLAEVVEMRAAFRAPRTSALWLTIGRDKYNMDPRSTAIPSLTSPHLDGFCLDISDNGFLAWLKSPDPRRPGHNIAARYGLVFTLLRENDLRHCQYFPGTATAALDVTSLNNATPTPPTIYGDTMLSMNRTKDNTIAFFDQEHWQEFKYTSDNAPTATIKQYQLDFLNGLNHSIPSVPYDDLGWNLRSNKLPALKKPFFVDNGTSIIPIAQTDGTVADNSAVLAAIAALDAQADAYQSALLSKLDGVDEATLATFGLKRA